MLLTAKIDEILVTLEHHCHHALCASITCEKFRTRVMILAWGQNLPLHAELGECLRTLAHQMR